MNKLKPHIGKLALVFIFFAYSCSTVLWTLKDKTPPAWDPADHLSAGYDYYAPLARGSLKGFAQEFFVEPHYYAPFVHLVTAAIFLLFHPSRLTGIGANFISLAVLLVSVNWLCRKLYSDDTLPTAGKEISLSAEPSPASENNPTVKTNANPAIITMSVLAALLASSYHFSAWLLHDGFLDYPLMALVAASFALLIKADDFARWQDALWFGVVAGLGMLTKQTFAFFFLLPAVYVSVRVLWSRRPKALANLALAGLLVLGISAIWYWPHRHEVIEIYQVNKAAAINENEAPLYSIMSNLYYAHGIISPQTQLIFGLLFVVGLIYSLIQRRQQSRMLYLWLLSGLGAFTMIANKDLRYTVPVLPAVAILSVCWIGRINFASANKFRRALKLAPVALLTVWCLISFGNSQWPAEGQGYYIDSPRFRWMVFARNYFGFDHKPLPSDWAVPQIIQAVDLDWQAYQPTLPNQTARQAHANPPPTADETVSPTTYKAYDDAETPVLGSVVNLPQLNPSTLALYARLAAKERGAPARIKIDWLTAESSKDRLAGVDYLLIRTGLSHAEWLAPLERTAASIVQSGQFTKVAAFPIPLEDAEAVLYRRNQ
ncbi:MAG: glycosyltransferase family 39 protein [Acidobacteria bacterium]|nr:glycosyltransferase family 39 protein [Acidobacteriota bacterium]